MPVLGLHPDQDDDPGRQRAGRGAAHPRPGRLVDRRTRTGRRSPGGSATRPPTPGTTRSRWTGSPARAARSSAGTATIVGPGRVRVGDQEYVAGRGLRDRHRDGRRGPADRRPGRHPVLDQPRGGRGGDPAADPDRARRRRDRPRAVAGHGPVRRAGDGDRGQRPAARDGGAGVLGCRGRRRWPRTASKP